MSSPLDSTTALSSGPLFGTPSRTGFRLFSSITAGQILALSTLIPEVGHYPAAPQAFFFYTTSSSIGRMALFDFILADNVSFVSKICR